MKTLITKTNCRIEHFVCSAPGCLVRLDAALNNGCVGRCVVSILPTHVLQMSVDAQELVSVL